MPASVRATDRRTIQDDDTRRLIADLIADPAQGWSTGSFGAIAEFIRDADEAIMGTADVPARLAMATARGALAVDTGTACRPLAYHTPSADGIGWSSAIAFCQPATAATCAAHSVVTELGPDDHAVRDQDRPAILFDLGLAIPHVDACIRLSDPAAIAVLRGLAGRPLLGPDPGPRRAAAATGGHRVFMTRLSRIEVYQPVPTAGETSPEGPHTHLLPKLLAAGLAHSATTPIAEGEVAGLTMHAANPLRDMTGRPRPFDLAAHLSFAALFARYGDPRAAMIMQRVFDAVDSGLPPRHGAALTAGCEDLDGRWIRAAVKVALRQARQMGIGAPALIADWQHVHDPAGGDAAR
ncbi:hypothetical protein WG926_02040 [Tistrella sp. BH-R2-4]|uniref:Uncharacterized protein n=1 Tax=Tistrella arctica TaxID=3133430 RepID=A0ABU9YEA8_9PROT